MPRFFELMETLRRVPCYPMVVFDHPEVRLPQKARENAKRRVAHALHVERFAHEQARHARIEALVACVEAYDTLAHDSKGAVSALLRAWGSSEPAQLPPCHEWLAEHHFDTEAQFQDDMLDLCDYAEEEEEVVDSEPPQPSLTEHLAQELYTLSQAHLIPMASKETSSQHSLTIAESFVYAALRCGHLDSSARLVAHDNVEWDVISAELERTIHRVDAADMLGAFQRRANGMCVHDIVHALYALSACLERMYYRSAQLVPKSAYTHMMQLCRHFGVPVMVTGSDGDMHEGEALASALVRGGYADMVATEDSDVLLYQVPLLRGLSNMSLELIDTSRVYASLFPNAAQPYMSFLEFALLCGTDFNRTVPGIGPTRAAKLIAEHATIQAALDAHKGKYAPPDQLAMDAYLAELDDARAIFLNLPSVHSLARTAGLQYAPHASCEAVPGWAAFLQRPVYTSPPPSYDRRALRDFLRKHNVHIN